MNWYNSPIGIKNVGVVTSLMFAAPHLAFGVNAKLKKNISFVDEQRLMYAVGAQMATYHTELKSQTIHGIVDVDYVIHDIDFVPQRSTVFFYMTSENPDAPALIVTLDMNNPKRRKIVAVDDFFSKKKCIAISHTKDPKLLLLLYGEPEWYACVCSISKGKFISRTKLTPPSNRIWLDMECNPYDSNMQISLIGTRLVRIFTFVDGSWKAMAQVKSDRTFVKQCWLNATTLAVGSDDGQVSIIQNGQITHQIMTVVCDDAGIEEEKPFVTALVNTVSGFYVGMSTGHVCLVERNRDNDEYQKTKETYTSDRSYALDFALNPNEDRLAIITSSGQLYHSRLEMDVTAPFVIEDAFTPFHSGTVVGLDTCLKKPLTISCGSDNSVRLWNYFEGTLQASKTFDQDTLGVAIHPTGLYALVGLTDSLVFLNIYIDGIKEYWRGNIPGCRKCLFSNGGHLFAVIYESSIKVYNVWTLRQVWQLNAHETRLRHIQWMPDDRRILASGYDGSLIVWSIQNGTKKFSYIPEGSEPRFIGFCPSHHRSLRIYAYTEDGRLFMLRSNKDCVEIPIKKKAVQSVWSSKTNILYVGTSLGAVMALSMSEEGVLKSMSEISVHAGSVSRLCLSYDGKFLFSAGEDGVIYTHLLKESKEASDKIEKSALYSDEVLVTVSVMTEHSKEVAELKTKIETLKKEHERQLKSKITLTEDTISETIQKFTLDKQNMEESIESDTETIALQLQQNSQEAAAVKEQIQNVSCHFKELFDGKIRNEEQNTTEMKAKLDKCQQDYNDRVAQIQQEIEKEKQALLDMQEQALKLKDEQIKDVQTRMARQAKEFQNTIADIETQSELEINELRFAYELKIKNEKTEVKLIRDENLNMKRKFESLSKQIEDHKKTMNNMTLEGKRLETIADGLTRDLAVIRHDINQRDETAKDKEKRVIELKRKNQELDKFKYVLEYKIAELRKQVEPKEADISSLVHQIQDMNKEMVQFERKNDELNGQIEDLGIKINTKNREYALEHRRVTELAQKMSIIQSDLRKVIKKLGDKEGLKSKIADMFHRYQAIAEDPTEYDIQSDDKGPHKFDIHSDHLHRTACDERVRRQFEFSLWGAKNKVAQIRKLRFSSNLKVTEQNVALTAQINHLRTKLDTEKMQLIKTSKMIQNEKKHGLGEGNLLPPLPHK